MGNSEILLGLAVGGVVLFMITKTNNVEKKTEDEADIIATGETITQIVTAPNDNRTASQQYIDLYESIEPVNC